MPLLTISLFLDCGDHVALLCSPVGRASSPVDSGRKVQAIESQDMLALCLWEKTAKWLRGRGRCQWREVSEVSIGSTTPRFMLGGVCDFKVGGGSERHSISDQTLAALWGSNTMP